MRKISAILLCVFLSLAILSSGCTKASKKPVPENTSPSGVQQTSDSEKRVMASRFSNLATSVDGVQKATVVVSNTLTAAPTGTTVDPNSVSALSPPGNPMPENQNTTTNPVGNPGTDTTGLSSPTGEIPDTTTGRIIVMVGLTLSPQAAQDQTKVNTIKEQVKQKIMADDQRVSEVLTSTNPDTIKKLQDVAAGVIQGKPFQSYAQDINDLDKSIRTQ